ncbi:hypothetical protein DFS34DRAFT_646157 [Phlyctochytrium arcticum]|nr:hypothetical protein DFS34DRAFT_646157 [Phlyctochytrium arcticum]
MTSAAWALLEQLPALEGNMYGSQADFVKWMRILVKYCDEAKLPLLFNDSWIEPINPAFSSLENTHLSASTLAMFTMSSIMGAIEEHARALIAQHGNAAAAIDAQVQQQQQGSATDHTF